MVRIKILPPKKPGTVEIADDYFFGFEDGTTFGVAVDLPIVHKEPPVEEIPNVWRQAMR